ncbi:DUF456 domain-containing protein [Cytophagales bacterium LB-30]|uniref:DUF456 domain-containing protein n=1 Tax=Shiella aurantiaca TaxID=3058365 RepID=A0ABT8F4Y7_9BACT|nr:DUF456 domain-containing protein [Shiella aurantiaca]MDN4165455.1 DUF456 domain-containing protein [Shiella aurantiaca]
MDWILISIACLLSLVGLIGCIIPGIPGPPLNWLALLLLFFLSAEPLTTDFLLIWLVVTVLVTGLDYWIPAAGTKKMGGTRYGVWGSLIGLIIGLFFFPPIGLIFGPFLGALAGEMYAGQNSHQAFRAALGSFLGLLVGTVAKLIASGMMVYYAVKASLSIW